MSKALYTKYRPNTFDEVIGQDIAVQILQRSIDLNKINHAYLFYGVRGTGKTTLARIFAKTINCSSPISNNPCNECESCKAFNNGSAFDMIEIDAASHNGVDEIRDLTEKANYSTTSSKYKVYIIDEVHMLSKSAFNALLKTLEEPPKNTIFLLATTEINKIPDTILSRTIVLNLQLVSADKIKEQLIRILNNENIDYEAEALDYIAKLADGSVRDAISFLETALLYSNSLTKENVIKVLGVLDTETIKNILLNNSIESIELINETINGFRLSLLFIDELISLIKTGKNEYKSLLDKITDGILSIKDPILLNRYLRSIFIQGVNISNVSRETINEQKEDTKETNVVENVSRETILDKKEETVKEIEENVDISAEETIEEPIENTEKTKEIVIEEKETDHIFNYISPKDIVNEMLLNDELQLSSLNNK
jgi:DNA polymerase-3 subunit gamma/tau